MGELQNWIDALGLVTVGDELAAHEGAADPHTGYQKESERAAANGYAPLDAASKVPTANLGGAGADNTKYLRGDQTWQTPAGGSEAFPVGAVFIAVVATDPATLLGYGTWSAIAAGRMLIGLDSGDTKFDTVKETGGAETVTLTTTELPAHTHVQDAHTHVQDSHTHIQDAHSHVVTSQTATTGGATSYEHGTLDTSSAEAEATETTATAVAVNQVATAVNQTAVAVNQSTGTGTAFSIMNPYFVVYMWERTA